VLPLLLGCLAPRPLPSAAPEPLDQLSRLHLPLATVDPAASDEDLVPLGPVLAARRVVGLGEATHGTAEFFQLKHRLFRWLVERHGVTLLAMELPYGVGLRINDWLATGQGDLGELLQGSYWWLDSGELLALFAWMREHNVRHPERPVELFGFDVQRPEDSARALSERLAQPQALLAALAAGGPRELADLEGASAELDQLRVQLAREPRALGHVEVLAQAVGLMRYCDRGANSGCMAVGRDEYMADNVLRRLEQTDARAVVWAHNGHVAHAPHADGWQPMGELLQASLGDDYYAVAIEFDRGSFVALAGGVGQTGPVRGRVAEYTVGPAPEGTLAHALRPLGSPWFLDLRALPPELQAWLDERRALTEYGAVVPGPERPLASQDVLHEAYDGLLFVESTRGYTFLH
jgi:erythromycin esterase